MSSLLKMINAGYSEEKILNIFRKISPNIAKKIGKMILGGYTAKDMLSSLLSDKEANKVPLNRISATPSEDVAGFTALVNSQSGFRSQDEKDQEIIRKAAKGLLYGGTAVAGMMGMSRIGQALGMGESALPTGSPPNSPGPNSPGVQVLNPQSPQPLQPGPTLNQQVPQQAQAPVANAMQPAPPGQVAAASQALPQTQAQSQTQPVVNQLQPIDLLLKHKLLGQVEQAYKNYKDPKAIAGILSTRFPNEMKAYQADAGKPMEEAIAEYLQTKPQQEEQPKPIAKNETVATPHGVGEVKSDVRNGKAIVEVNGKNHKVDEKNLLKPPKEAAVEALELIKGFTPEEMRSTHHMLNAYDEGEQKGFFVFHNGSAYVVDDISPEEYKELSEEVEKAKTTGETIIGKWASGEGSRGAGYNKVVKGVRDRKVVPELKKKFRKLKVGYNLLSEWQRLLNEK